MGPLINGHRRIPHGMLCLSLAAAAIATGCGSAGSPSGGSGSVPTMVIVNIGNTPQSTSITTLSGATTAGRIQVSRGQPVMFMVTNESSSSKEIHVPLPVDNLQIDNTSSGQSDKVKPTATQVSLKIAPGPEVDITFEPTAAGHYIVDVNGHAVGTVVVG